MIEPEGRIIYFGCMKPESMRKAFLVFFAVLTALFVAICWPFAKAAFLAFTLAVIFHPLQRFVVSRLKLPRYVGAIFVTAVVAVCVILPIAVLLGVVVTQIGHFLQGVAAQVQGDSFSDTVGQLLIAMHGWIERIWGSAPPLEELKGTLMTGVQGVAKWFYNFSPRVLTTTLSALVNFVLMLLFLVVFLAEGGGLYRVIMESTPLSEDHRKELARDVRLTIITSIAAAVIVAIVQGTLLGVGFMVAGFSQPMSWGLIAVILSVIPIIGASSCYITATALLFAAGDVQGAIIFLLFGLLVVSSADNLMRPFIVRSASRMHPLLLFVVLIGGVNLFGPIGILVGPVLLAIFLASLGIYRREFVQK